MSFFQFIKSRLFFRHLLIMVFLSILLAWAVVLLLNVYTRHNSEQEMPDVRGYLPEELESNSSFSRYEYVVIDSVYDTSKPKGTILTQDPYPGSKVKSGRQVYISLVAISPEQVSMPDLNDLTLRQAKSVLETYGLRIGVLTYVPDIGKTVMKQSIGHKVIEPGTMVEKGLAVNLVLGEGVDNERIIVPILVGKTYNEALAALQLAGFNLGEEVYMDSKDIKEIKVFRQQPLPNFKAGKGTRINLWYRSAKRFDFNNYLKTFEKDSLYYEEETETP